jgi:V8-like Glu-specific endopeptidase
MTTSPETLNQHERRRGAGKSSGSKRFRLPGRMRSRAMLTVIMAGAGLLGLMMLGPVPRAEAVGGPTASWGSDWAVGKIQTPGFLCTGTLIAPTVVLTVAQCAVTPGSTITFGQLSGSGVNTIQGTAAQTVNAPGADLALVKVEYDESDGIAPVFPPTPQTVNYAVQGVGTPMTAVGYGLTNYPDNGSWQLPKYQVQATGGITAYGPHGSYGPSNYLLSGLIACDGDAGAPVLVNNQVVGVITSSNRDTGNVPCGTMSSAVAVSDWASWIQSTTQTLQNGQ